MATALAHIAVPSRTENGLSHEVTVWQTPSGAIRTTCTCPQALYRPNNRCAHRETIEQTFLDTGWRRHDHTLTHQPATTEGR